MADITSLGFSVIGGVIYRFDGGVLFECGTSGGFAFGISVPALAAGGSYVEMGMMSAATQGTANNTGRVAFGQVAALNTAVVSVSVATLNSLRFMHVKGFLQPSASGSVNIMAKTSVAGASMSVRSAWLQVWLIGVQ